MESNLKILSYPFADHMLCKLRDKNTPVHEFKSCMEKVSVMLALEASKNFKTVDKKIETPLAPFNAKVFAKKLTIVPVLRAGLGMSDAIYKMFDNSSVGHIGMYRNEETCTPVEYYSKFPEDVDKTDVLLCDPMLATGGTTIKSLEMLIKRNVTSITVLAVIASEEGISKVRKQYPNIPIYVAAVDKEMNAHSYIVPGLGDAGDRTFGT